MMNAFSIPEANPVRVNGVTIGWLAYADDLLLLDYTPAGLQHMLDSLAIYTAENGLTINIDKSKIMVFSNKCRPKKYSWSLESKKVEQVKSYKYLGVVIDEKLNWEEQWSSIESRCTVAANALSVFIGRNCCYSVIAVLNIYLAKIRSMLLYAVDIWGHKFVKRSVVFESILLRKLLRLPPRVLHYVKNVHVKNSVGEEIFFDANGDAPPYFDLLYWHMTSNNSSRFERVGMYNAKALPGYQLTINNSAIKWGGKYTQVPTSVCSESCPQGYRITAAPGRPNCCFHCFPCPEGSITNHTDSIDCLKCPDDEWSNRKRNRCIPKETEFLSFNETLGLILVLAAILFVLNTTGVLWVFVRYRQTPVVRANNLHLSYILLAALMMCFLCALVFIGKPGTMSCMLRQVIFGISFSLCVSSVLAKTITVVIAFRATKPNSNLRRLVGSRTSYTIVLVPTLIQSVIGVIWLWRAPPFPELNMKSTNGKMIAECNEGSILMFYCMLSFMGLLACVSFMVAFLARNLPDSFNEAKFITFSMLVFVSVWLSFIPAYLSTNGKYLVAVEIFAILSSGAGLLYFIFAPKMYIIFMKPEMNTREYIASKSTLSNSN
ncbi:vomeronasal type-2 receptor 26-like [Ambystoma mexicanum]|uniref:vomeronasal type-2 receptor 26-like n=1 Tax=Ambystoma mexicanum TaxID=8296 RepID=UPI0037E70021